jgi:aldehyde dehydrogenase (NAD+)
VRAFEEAQLQPGALNLVYGAGPTVGAALVDDARVRAISFTGSREVGRVVNAQASARGARAQLEVGSVNPVIVLSDADLELAVDSVVRGAFGFAGQRATSTSRVLVEASIYESFAEKLVSRARAIKVGDGLADPTAMGPITDEKQLASLLEAIELAKQEGATVICGGERVGLPGPDQGYFLAPTVLADAKADMKIAREETFGPIVSLISVQDFEHAIEIANQVEGCASSSIFTRDFTRVMQYAERARTQAVHVNSPTLGNETSEQARQFFSELKTVHLDYNSQSQAPSAR